MVATRIQKAATSASARTQQARGGWLVQHPQGQLGLGLEELVGASEGSAIQQASLSCQAPLMPLQLPGRLPIIHPIAPTPQHELPGPPHHHAQRNVGDEKIPVLLANNDAQSPRENASIPCYNWTFWICPPLAGLWSNNRGNAKKSFQPRDVRRRTR